jgi:hypothetical protein
VACAELSTRRSIRTPALGLGVAALCGWWAVTEGGAAPTVWYPGALALLAAAAAVVRPSGLRRLPPAGRVALAALAAFTAWSLLSIAWADARGDAWDGANRTLLYLCVFALFALVPWTPADATAVLAGFVLAAAAAGTWALVAAIGGDPTAFGDGRLAGPVGYENASAALLLGAFWPAVLLAARRATGPLLRGTMLAAAGLLLALAILAQSRASLIGGGVALAVGLWFTRERVRLLIALAAVALTTSSALPVLLAVYRSPDHAHGALVRAAFAIAISVAVLFAAGAGSVRLDRRRTVPRGLVRWSAALTAAAVVLAAAVAIARPAPVSAGLSSRFTGGVESGRYDLWRVAAGQLARHPLLGAGAGNFAHDYARDGRARQEVLYPHSLEWGVLGQTGLVGGALLAGFLAAAFAVLASVDPARRALAVAALAAAAYWVAHASFDWLWELPAVTAPAIACLGLAVGLALRDPPAGRRRLVGAALVVAGAVAVVSLALPALAAREVERAARIWGGDPAAGLRAIESARRLNPLSARPDAVGGALARDPVTARRELTRALARDPRDWHAEAELGVLALEAGRRAEALARLDRARELAPRAPAIAVALRAAEPGEVAERPTAQATRRAVPAGVEAELARLAVPGLLGRRPVTCRPVLGLAAACSRRAGG